MQVIKTDKYIKLIADEGKKITGKGRTFFNEFIFVPPDTNIEEYEEVGYEVWKHFSDEVPTNKVEELQSKIEALQGDRDNLETILLNTDFRLTCMELKDKGLLD